jgi:hypothetical protein
MEKGICQIIHAFTMKPKTFDTLAIQSAVQSKIASRYDSEEPLASPTNTESTVFSTLKITHDFDDETELQEKVQRNIDEIIERLPATIHINDISTNERKLLTQLIRQKPDAILPRLEYDSRLLNETAYSTRVIIADIIAAGGGKDFVNQLQAIDPSDFSDNARFTLTILVENGLASEVIELILADVELNNSDSPFVVFMATLEEKYHFLEHFPNFIPQTISTENITTRLLDFVENTSKNTFETIILSKITEISLLKATPEIVKLFYYAADLRYIDQLTKKLTGNINISQLTNLQQKILKVIFHNYENPSSLISEGLITIPTNVESYNQTGLDFLTWMTVYGKNIEYNDEFLLQLIPIKISVNEMSHNLYFLVAALIKAGYVIEIIERFEGKFSLEQVSDYFRIFEALTHKLYTATAIPSNQSEQLTFEKIVSLIDHDFRIDPNTSEKELLAITKLIDTLSAPQFIKSVSGEVDVYNLSDQTIKLLKKLKTKGEVGFFTLFSLLPTEIDITRLNERSSSFFNNLTQASNPRYILKEPTTAIAYRLRGSINIMDINKPFADLLRAITVCNLQNKIEPLLSYENMDPAQLSEEQWYLLAYLPGAFDQLSTEGKLERSSFSSNLLRDQINASPDYLRKAGPDLAAVIETIPLLPNAERNGFRIAEITKTGSSQVVYYKETPSGEIYCIFQASGIPTSALDAYELTAQHIPEFVSTANYFELSDKSIPATFIRKKANSFREIFTGMPFSSLQKAENIPPELWENICMQRAKILHTLSRLHVNHGHPHGGNFNVRFLVEDTKTGEKLLRFTYADTLSEVDSSPDTELKITPIVTLRDWDRAVIDT